MRLSYLLFVVGMTLVACGSSGEQVTSEAVQIGETYESQVLKHPDWSKNATIYEVNVRQHTPEGTFKAFEADIPRLKEMGVDILWLMPIHPIGEVNRKGSLGSYYAVQDYKGVNSEFGDMADFQHLVSTAHSYGMKVIIDWVANHTAFDNHWTTEHMDYYLLDSLGKIQPPLGTDWTDVAQLDWENKELWSAMTDALEFWVEEADIDGYRCDVAEKVPTAYWNEARAALDSIKPVFMLAEAELPELHEAAFDMSYSWEFIHLMNQVAAGKEPLEVFHTYMLKEDTNFVASAYRMMFTTNHDENSWNGTVFERYGDAHKAYATLAFTINGMPLVYSGQEAGNTKRLKFFEKDTIEWGNYPLQDFYSKLLKVNQEEEALWNGHHGGKYSRLTNSEDDRVFSFERKKNGSHIITMVNLSDSPATPVLDEQIQGEFHSIFDNAILSEYTNGKVTLPAYGYQVFVKKK